MACVPEAKEPVYKGQSYRDAISTMCNVDKMAGLENEGDPLAKDRKREDFLNDRVENPDAVYVRTLLKVRTSSERAAALREEAKECGLKDCALADSISNE